MNQRPPISLPTNLTVERKLDHIRICRQWLSKKSIAIIIFAIGWDYFTISALIKFSNAEPADSGSIKIITILTLVAVGVTYFAIATLANRTQITVNRKQLIIKHAPIPWFGNKQLTSSELIQLFVFERPREHRTNGEYTPPSFGLRAITKRGKNLLLLTNLDQEQALYLEQEIENYLAIKDKPVNRPNEVR
jgi:hypothetical protein